LTDDFAAGRMAPSVRGVGQPEPSAHVDRSPTKRLDATAALLKNGNSQLRPYQGDAIAKVEGTIEQGIRRMVLLAPTGAGKTLIASSIVENLHNQSRPVIFTVPALELIDQTLEKFHAAGVNDVGIIQANHWQTDSSRPIQIASVQTLMRRRIPPADLVFIDETHRWFDFYRRWMLDPQWSNVPCIGLSATPWTKGLGAYYQQLIIAATTQDLIDQGYLSKFKVFAPAHPDLEGVRTLAGDYQEDELAVAMNRRPLIANIVETWLKHGVGRPTLCFAVNRAHAEHIQQMFLEAGVPAGYIDCETKAEERKQIRSKFASGEYQVVCNVGVLTTGVDWDVRCIILARPTKSEILFVQIIGRGLRIAEGKDYCLILDHSDTTSRLGFVTDIHHDELNDGRTRVGTTKGIRLPKECPRCACLRPAGTNVCPHCGFVAKPVDKVRVVNGELRELSHNRQAIFNKAQVFGEFKGIALERGYKPGFAFYKFKEFFGEEPRNLSHVEPQLPSRTIRNWVKSRQIAYAKAHPRPSLTLSSSF
jgi:DNA repair protein RadD